MMPTPARALGLNRIFNPPQVPRGLGSPRRQVDRKPSMQDTLARTDHQQPLPTRGAHTGAHTASQPPGYLLWECAAPSL